MNCMQNAILLKCCAITTGLKAEPDRNDAKKFKYCWYYNQGFPNDASLWGLSLLMTPQPQSPH